MNGKDASLSKESRPAPRDQDLPEVMKKLADLADIEGVVLFSPEGEPIVSSLPSELIYDGAIKRIADVASISSKATRDAGLGEIEQFLIDGASRKALYLKRRETGYAAALVGGEGMNIALARIKLQEILQDF